MVCGRNVTTGSRLGRKAETAVSGGNQCDFIHRNGNDAVAAYLYGNSGA